MVTVTMPMEFERMQQKIIDLRIESVYCFVDIDLEKKEYKVHVDTESILDRVHKDRMKPIFQELSRIVILLSVIVIFWK